MLQTHATIHGQIQGTTWMPAYTCTKDFTVSEDDFRYSDGSRPTLRDMVLRATNDGDFQSANVSWGHLTVETIVTRKDGRGTLTRKRHFDLRDSAGRGHNAVELERPELLVVLHHRAFALDDDDVHRRLVVRSR